MLGLSTLYIKYLLLGNAELLVPAVIIKLTGGGREEGMERKDYKGEELERERREGKEILRGFVVANLRSKTFRFHSVICSIIDQ